MHKLFNGAFILTLFFCFLSAKPALASDTEYFDRYPSMLTMKRLIKNGTKNIFISSSEGLDENYDSIVDYPQGSHVRTLNHGVTVGNMSVKLNTLSSAYPSRANIKDINALESSIELTLEITTCLGSMAQSNRLAAIDKVAHVVIQCRGNSEERRRAEIFAEELIRTKENLSIEFRHHN